MLSLEESKIVDDNLSDDQLNSGSGSASSPTSVKEEKAVKQTRNKKATKKIAKKISSGDHTKKEKKFKSKFFELEAAEEDEESEYGSEEDERRK